MALSILSLNTNGLRDSSKRASVLQWFRSFPQVPDIVCLQETTALRTVNVSHGFIRLVSVQLLLLALHILVVASFYFVPQSHLRALGVTLLGVLFFATLPILGSRFVSAVSMPQIATRAVTTSWMTSRLGLTPPTQPSLSATLTLFLTLPLIVGAPMSLTLPMKVLLP